MKIIWKTSTLLILTVILIYLWFGHFSPFQEVVNAEDGTASSTIGGQEVNSRKKEELVTLLNRKIMEWKENPVYLTGDNIDVALSSEWFTFDVDSTVDEYLKKVDVPWFAFWKSEPIVHIPLQFTIDPEVNRVIEQREYISKDETLANIVSQVGILSSDPIEAVASNLSLPQMDRIAFEIETPPINSTGLNDIISILNNQPIGSEEVFSLLDHLKGIDLKTYHESADFVASMLYSALLQTNFEIVERHSQNKIASYLEPGIEAQINEISKKDLKFINKNNTAAILKISRKDSRLLLEIYSNAIDVVAEYEVRDRVEVKPRIIYRYSADLSPGQEELLQEGIPGARVSVYRKIADKSGPFQKEELISKDYYPPVNRIILTSVDADTSLVSDPDLAIDLNGDGLSDVENVPPASPNNDSDSDGLPEGYYYDKAGNILKLESE